jgi:ESS family glutamate:Na+ symporter
MWLMTLDLTRLHGVALPLIVNLVLQVALIAAALRLVFRLMGGDYDSAVMSGGFTGFMLGTTATALAVMRTVVARHGPAPRAFLVAPVVGAFFIDFTNALIINAFLNILR